MRIYSLSQSVRLPGEEKKPTKTCVNSLSIATNQPLLVKLFSFRFVLFLRVGQIVFIYAVIFVALFFVVYFIVK